MPTDELPPQAYAAALATVPSIRTQYLRTLLGTVAPRAAWASVVAGGPWAAEARRVDVAATWRAHRDAGVEVLVAGDGRYPRVLAGEPAAPAVLFALGDPRVADRHPRVAVVGTRNATRYGLGMAAQLGAELAAAGVAVVSGLALGIDGAVHEGAIGAWRAAGGSAGPPVAVVPRALDEPYPRSHRRLWERVASAGAVLTDAPVGTEVPRWRFPHRNRIMAALADVVVVVECHATGGSLHTVRAAVGRGRIRGGRAGLGPQPRVGRHQRPPGRRVLRGAGRHRCPGGPRPGPRRRGPRAAARRPDREPAGGGVGVADGPEDDGGRGGRNGAPGPAGNGHAVPAGAGGSRGGPPDGGAPGTADGGEEQDDDGEGGGGNEAGRRVNGGGGGSGGGGGNGGGGEADAAVLRALEWEPCSVEDLLRRTGLPLATVAASLERLRARGRVHGRAGWWEAQ